MDNGDWYKSKTQKEIDALIKFKIKISIGLDKIINLLKKLKNGKDRTSNRNISRSRE